MAMAWGNTDGGQLPDGGPDARQQESGVQAPQLLLQQLHQVQEELERYYLKCLDLEAERQIACVARDDARREIDALRLQLQHLQRALVESGTSRPAASRLRTLLARVTPRRRGKAGEENAPARRRRLDMMRSSEYFDADWYLAQYPDVRVAGMDPAEHYDEFGWKEARNPGPGFDTAWYLRANPDVAASGMNPLWHFVEHGSREGRRPRAQ
jgi:hypothetical protein